MKDDVWTRRSLMRGMGAAVPAFAVGTAATAAPTQMPAGEFRPARHPLDAWLDQVPGQHRVFIDSATADGAGEAVLYANNLYRANREAYSIDADELAMVICFRHFATVFGYNDAVWAKYGELLSRLVDFNDPKTGEAAAANLLDSPDYGMSLPNMGNTIGAQADRGAQFAICNAATSFFSSNIAQEFGGSAEDVHEELVANAIPNSRFVSAGVIATTRAQEYGFSLLYAG
ncbi:MAG: hypothetical protein PVJ49_01520 [Acidobacteriota bacterium]|jgi:hypothetical protein